MQSCCLCCSICSARIPRSSSGQPQLSKARRVEHARETTQADAAAADRTAQRAEPTPPGDDDASGAKDSAEVVSLPWWVERACSTRDSVDRQRRTRREAAVGDGQLEAPARHGTTVRQRSLFLLD